MSTYAIGDVQGCADELKALLDKIQYDPAVDQLWFVGDLVNRGPKSLATLRLVRGLPNVVTVLGNHDLHLLAMCLTDTAEVNPHTMDDILNAPDRDELIDWLRQQPLLHRDPHQHITLVHAGIPPCWDLVSAERHAAEVAEVLRGDQCAAFLTQLYGNEPNQWHEDLQGWDRLRFIINAFTRMRYCDAAGRLQLEYKGPPDQAPENHIPWFELPSKLPENERILFGHWASLGGKVNKPNLFALDTGCVWGNTLTALRLDDFQTISVSV